MLRSVGFSTKTIKSYAVKILIVAVFPWMFLNCQNTQEPVRDTIDFNKNWRFVLGDIADAETPSYDDASWRQLNVPHDWSIEGSFSAEHPATPGGGALPGGIGWYRKSFILPDFHDKSVFVEFDGVYQNSEVWINGHYLGKRPNGYISFGYEITSFLNKDNSENIIAVKVDNSQQPNSRWYSGSGIYRKVRLVIVDQVHVARWGTYIATPEVNDVSANVLVRTTIRNVAEDDREAVLMTTIYDANGREVSSIATERLISKESTHELTQELMVNEPIRWSVENPYLYTAKTLVQCGDTVCDDYETVFGIRTFQFDVDRGFILNGHPQKILGICNHHDLGALGAAVNIRALERQLEIMKEMGVNGIRTSHNPPAPELLDLADRMGFIVMDEAFDMWKLSKTRFDYHLYWDEWHEQDLVDFVRRDRNHPSIFLWSIGNEIREQWDSTGYAMAQELADIVKNLDDTRPITSGLNHPGADNFITSSGILDVIGFNYHLEDFVTFPEIFPGRILLATETTSALATRGHYDMPSDSVRIWPSRWDRSISGNPNQTCSAYDNCRVPWGSTHEEAWKMVKQYDYISGMFIWTGFDYLGEPTPYWWPSRSSYFGIVDLAGFPKDAYYMYQSEWTDKPVLHLFPHWNWSEGDTVDAWVYTSANEVELFLNDQSLGTKQKSDDDLHLMWRVPYSPGTLRAVGQTELQGVLTTEVTTAGAPAAIMLSADRGELRADGYDLAFVTVDIVDEAGVLAPHAENLVTFVVEGNAFIAGVDNGSQTSHEPFKADYRRAFNGKCLVILQSEETPGSVTLTASSEGLRPASVEINLK